MNLSDTVFYALGAMLFMYGGAVIALTAALFKKDKSHGKGGDDGGISGNDGLPGVSVVIPFRNEEQNLGALLESLSKQSYGGMIEVILVDDQSDDGGVGIIKQFSQLNDGIDIKIIYLHPSTEIRLTSKQQALDLGVDNSSHPLIAFTDADMILAPNWIESLVKSHLSTNTALTFGHTSIINASKKSLFADLESFQLAYLFAFAHAFARLNLTGSCMGNNVLITKEAYRQIGGQRGIGYSIVEDRALLAAMRRKKLKTGAAEPFGVTAETYPSKTKKQFYNQMTRWAAGGLRPGGGLFTAGLLLLTQNVVFLLSVAGIIEGIITIHAAANFFMTWLFIAASLHKNRSPAPKWLFPVHYLFLMIETVIFGVALVFRPRVDWKGRKV